MDERAHYGSAAELTEAAARIKLLVDDLHEVKQALNKWKIDIDVDVRIDKRPGAQWAAEIYARLGSGRGVRKTVSASDAAYHMADKDNFIKNVAQEILLALLEQSVIQELSPKLSAAMTNLNRLSSSQGKGIL